MPLIPEQFLNTYAGFIQLDSGKIINAESIGRNGLRLAQRMPVEWDMFDRSGNRLKSMITFDISPAITNSYISRSRNAIIIEFDTTDQNNTPATAQTIFNREKFTGQELESLPSKDEEYQQAVDTANEANEINSGMSWMDKLKLGAVLVGIGVIAPTAIKIYKELTKK